MNMSSYQFLNHLGYPQTGNQGQGGRSGASPVDPTEGSPSSDYYNPNAGVVGSYAVGSGCYSPQAQYNAAAVQYMQQSPSGMMDYTQLHSATHQRLSQHLQPLNSLPSPENLPSPILNNNNNGSSTVTVSGAGGIGSQSCKYADSTTGAPTGTPNGVASPQDLSTSGPPTRSPGPLNIKTSRSSGASSVALASPPLLGAQNSQHSGPASQASSSPASSTSSSSTPGANNSSSGNGGKSSGGGPPQIYPWMKRVHLGQSEYQIPVFYIHLRLP